MHKKLIALSIVGLATSLQAGHNNNGDCDDCCSPTYCLGPVNVNPSVRPKTCDSDLSFTVAALYWGMQQDGMEYAINNQVATPPGTDPSIADIQELNNIRDGEYERPNNKWNYGLKVGAGYNMCHDGWDVSVLWTWYHGRANGLVQTDTCDGATLIPIWSAFAPTVGNTLYACSIKHNWKVKLNLVDIELGREFWTSCYLSLRPHIGIRYASISQDWVLTHSGGSWAENTSSSNPQPAFNNTVDIDNDFCGTGPRAGLDTTWRLNCGFALFGNFAASLVYGRFEVDHDETNTWASSPFDKYRVYENEANCKSARAILDLAIGIQWSALIFQCKYAFTGMLAWEQHHFFGQNQMWRAVRNGDGALPTLPNNSGENVYQQRRGSLSTQGVTLTFKFEF